MRRVHKRCWRAGASLRVRAATPALAWATLMRYAINLESARLWRTISLRARREEIVDDTTLVQVVCGALAVLCVVIVVMRRKNKKKSTEEEF